MFPWYLAKCVWLLYIGLFLADRASCQRWQGNRFYAWSDPRFGGFQSPYYNDWDWGFNPKFTNFFDRMMQNVYRGMRNDFAETRSNIKNPQMEKLLQKARNDFGNGDDGDSDRKIVRTGSCGQNCQMKVVLARNNGEYYEKWSQSSGDSYSFGK